MDTEATADHREAALRKLEHRLASQQRLLDERLLRVENNRLFALWKQLTSHFSVVYESLFAKQLAKSRAHQQAARYKIWTAHQEALLPTSEHTQNAIQSWSTRPSVSIRTPSIESASNQVYPYVEICAATPGRLKQAVQSCRGDYICFVDVDCELSPWAAYFVAEAVQQTSADVVYADHDEVAIDDNPRPIFKPGWSPELLKETMYFGPMIMARCDLFAEMLDPGKSSFHEVASSVIAKALKIERIPRVLSHRTQSYPVTNSTRNDIPAVHKQATAIMCSRNASLVARCLDSLHTTAAGEIGAIFVVAHEESGQNQALREAAAARRATVLPYTGPFNFSVMNNLAAQTAKTPYLLFLNDDITATKQGWVSKILAYLSQENIGVTGATLYYPGGSLQHAGIVSGIGDGVGHAGRGSRSSNIWPWLTMTRNVSAVTGACMAVRSDLFAQLGGFDPGFPNNYNDVDLCWRARERGYEVVCVAAPGIFHAECQTRQGIVRFPERYRLYERWGNILDRPDPWYSPVFAPTENIQLNLDPYQL